MTGILERGYLEGECDAAVEGKQKKKRESRKKDPDPGNVAGTGVDDRNQRLRTLSGTTVPSAMSTSAVITVPT